MAKPTVSPQGDISSTTRTDVTPNPEPGNTPTPGDGLNTGDNGFAIDGQLYTYDTGAKGAGGSQGAFKKTVDVSDAYTENGQPKDLKPATKLTLANYLSKLTMGKEGADATNAPPVPNRYPVGDGSTDNPSSLTDGKGFPAQLQNPPGNPASFAGGAEAIIDYPSSQYPALSPLIKKGLSSANTVDGHDLLAGVTGTSTTVTTDPNSLTGDAPQTKVPSVPGHADTSAKIINPYTSAVLSNNRFTGAAAAYAVNISDPDPGYNPALSVQSKLGVWDAKAPTYTMGRLATVGTTLTLRATQTLGATSSGVDPNSAGEDAAALLPSPNQLGVATIDQHVLQASDILKSLTNNEPSGANTLSIGTSSWGQLNDANDPYSGADALGMLTLSIALTVGLTLIIDLLSLILGAIGPQLKQPTHDDFGRYALGQYYANSKSGANGKGGGGPLGAVSALASLNFAGLLGIMPTNYPFSMAMQTGFNVFFGLPVSSGGFGNIGGQLLGALTSSTDSPEFNIIVARTIIRSSILIVNAFKKIGGNIIQAITAILGVIDVIRSSKIISAMNVWGQLGDAVLGNPAIWTDSAAKGGKKVSGVDARPDGILNAMSQNRMQFGLKLAWASNRSRANLLLPAFIVANNLAIPAMGGSQEATIGSLHDPRSKVMTAKSTDVTNARISLAAAQAIEAKLEAEYVPFYFHDLRTNEMVGFHAFLASLNDDYTANYERADGYGRVEPVRIYKQTERRVAMSFYVIATSELDFEDMWVKLNKLITLLYPQYTQGVQLSDPSGQYTFTQPFSQLIGAAPLVRIRLGDLLRSNYSKFALARLFGLGNSNFTVKGTVDTATTSLSTDNSALVSSALASALANPNGEDYHIAAGTYAFIDPASSGGGLSISLPIGGGPQGPKFAPVLDTSIISGTDDFLATAVGTTTQAIGSIPPGSLVCKIKINDDPKWQTFNADRVQLLTDQYGGTTDGSIPGPVGGTYVIPTQALRITDASKKEIVLKAYSVSGGAFAGNLSDFMSETNNAIAKSFADTGGKGLAGFIETMSFDWYDKVTWELHQGHIAPKMCKVTLTFAPIHDISPGIDHLGYNRAPIYPIALYNVDQADATGASQTGS